MSVDDGVNEVEAPKPVELTDRARVIFLLPFIEEDLYRLRYPNLKMMGNISSMLRRDFLDPESKPRITSPAQGINAPREEMQNFMAEWLMADMERLGMNDVAGQIEECGFRFDKVRQVRGVGTSQEADRLIGTGLSEMMQVGSEYQGQAVDPAVIVAEGARRAAEKASEGVDKPVLADCLRDFSMGLADLMRKGRWWDQILANPTA